MEKKVPMRRCVGCGISKDKRELLRIIRDNQGNICADATGKAAGRGAYVCKDPGCFEKAIKKKGFERAFKTPVPDNVLCDLKKELDLNG